VSAQHLDETDQSGLHLVNRHCSGDRGIKLRSSGVVASMSS
jgi:hypothetical protein